MPQAPDYSIGVRKNWEGRALEGLEAIDPSIIGLNLWAHPDFTLHWPDPLPELRAEPDLRLLAALSAAAQSAQAESKHLLSQESSTGLEAAPLAEVKRRIDGAATAAGEAIFVLSESRIEVRAGEGVRDSSPGAVMGQVFGPPGPAAHVVLDYVDGTGLAARGLPNALALGALGDSISLTPDVKAFAVLAPRSALRGFALDGPPTNAARRAVKRLARATGLAERDVRLLTHSSEDAESQYQWHQYLRGLTPNIVVPYPIAVEPPFLLSLTSSRRPIINGMVGVMGLVELVYASVMLDALRSDFEFKFRLVSSSHSKALMGANPLAFESSQRDEELARTAGLDVLRTYSSDQFVPVGSARCAALFAITDGQAVAIPAAGGASVSGLVAFQGTVIGLTITRAGGGD